MKTIGKKFILPMLCLIIAFSFSACSPKCAVEGCKNPAIDGHEYCEEHTCAVDGCYECVKSGSAYCEKHGCAIDSCPNLPIEGGNFCAIHTCAVEGCYNQVKSGSTYCEKHGCAVFDCPNLPIDGSKFCTEHTCTVNECYEQVKDGSAYCEKHGCAKAGCPKPHINGGRFCKEHTCKMEGCTEVGIYTDGYCEKHHPKSPCSDITNTNDTGKGLSVNNNSSSDSFPGRELDAWVCALDIVKGSLKAPSTAKFCAYPDATVKYNNGADYTVNGYVDAQNSYGASIRTRFTVTLTLTEKGYTNGEVVFY